MRRDWFTAACVGSALAIAMTTPGHAFGASFSWNKIAGCARVSPAFRLSDVPDGTASLSFMMVDLDVPSFHHGGSTVPYSGKSRVKRGAITYIGPCPPPGEKHRYRWAIEALDAQRKVLATTTATQMFPP
jgi:phosphatidylethanolamine-binding protein (PEBP) family uncharacterized protein